MGGKRKILVVEDEELIRSLAKAYLGRYYEVILANDGVEGLGRAGEHPDLGVVLTDCDMPRKTGYDVLKEYTGDAVVCVMTGILDEERARELRDLGAFEILQKPFSPITDLRHLTERAFAEYDRRMESKQ